MCKREVIVISQDWAKSFYNCIAWIKARDYLLHKNNFICNRCGGVASIVHHKTYLTPENIFNVDISLGIDNLECLCLDCHNLEHGVSGGLCGLQEGFYFDNEGQIRRAKE